MILFEYADGRVIPEGLMVAWMMAASTVAGSGALSLGVLLARRLLQYRDIHPAEESPSTTVPQIAMERYRPMARLFDDQDLQFLASRPGYRREMGARLRRSRRRVFRMYLAELSADFHRLHSAARRIVADAPEQHADMVGLLLQQEITFWRVLFGIEVRLALDWAGLGSADACRLLEMVEQLGRALATTQLSPQALMA
jgi:hypothetical protein